MNNQNLNNNGTTIDFQPPGNEQQYLLEGAIPHCGGPKDLLIITVDGTCIVAATLFRHSPMWGVMAGVLKQEDSWNFKIIRRIQDKFKDQENRFNRYVEFANCPPLSISFEDWTQSTADTINRLTRGLNNGNPFSLLLISSNVHWALKNRINKIYNKLDTDNHVQLPSHYLSDILKEGKARVDKGQQKAIPAVDCDYHILAVTKINNRFSVKFIPICPRGMPLDLADKSKNQGPPIEAVSFDSQFDHMDIILSKQQSSSPFFVSAHRVYTAFNPVNLSTQFIPLEDSPRLLAEGSKQIIAKNDITSIPPCRINYDQPKLQVAVLVDATMPEDQVQPLKEKLIAMGRHIHDTDANAQLGLAVYGDYPLDEKDSVEFQVNKVIPFEFFTFQQWEGNCNQYIKRMTPRDFMSSLDQGLIRIEFFPWDTAARKHLVIIFSSPPHPNCDPDRPVRKLPFTHAQKNWDVLLDCLKNKYGVDIIAMQLEKPSNVDAVREENIFVRRRMSRFDFKGCGLDKLDQIELSILKELKSTCRLEPENYHLPLITEKQP